MTVNADGSGPPDSADKPSKARVWIMEMRVPFLTASVTPVLLGTAVAWALTGVFLWDVFLLTLVAGVCLHLGANISNDYFDHKSGADDINVEFVRPFTGGSRMIQRGLLTPREVLSGSMVFFAIAALIGIYLAFTRGLLLLVIGGVGGLSGFFYTAPPIRLVTRGIGEVFIGLNFGVLMVLGSYYVQAQSIAWEPVVASLPVAFLITAVLYINEFPDAGADEAAGKRTLVVRLGKRRAAKGYAVIMFAVFFSLVAGVAMQLESWYALTGLATVPMAIFAARHALVHYDNTMILVPANVATILTHLLTGLFMTAGYILHGLAAEVAYVVSVGAAFFLISLHQAWKLSTPPQM
ncbi:MAG: 1,4-dihydroxy-2-naphthoate octaprenyltransferase [Candidatus Hermodarchaeota archaeon]